jgi:hypothetical protein
LVLLASPLLGPAVWSPVAAELRHRGWSVVEPPPYAEVVGPGDVLGHLLAAVPRHEPVILVPHSNAGLYVAALADRLDARGVVFVDAGLPAEAPATPSAPPAFRQFLSGLVDHDGLLPVWTAWWPAEDLEGLFPDGRARASVESEQRRLPIAYFEAAVPSPARWRDLPAAYLAFGDTYAAERASAEELGWPTAMLPGQHLHTLVDPAAVADALLGLVGQMGIKGA